MRLDTTAIRILEDIVLPKDYHDNCIRQRGRSIVDFLKHANDKITVIESKYIKTFKNLNQFGPQKNNRPIKDDLGIIYESTNAASEKLRIHKSSILRSIKDGWRAGGRVFAYVDEEFKHRLNGNVLNRVIDSDGIVYESACDFARKHNVNKYHVYKAIERGTTMCGKHVKYIR